MYRKIRFRLTCLFAGTASLILIVMSLAYAYLSESALRESSFLSFSGEMGTLLSHLEQQTVVSQEWLAKVGAEQYQVALYDNGSPLAYTAHILPAETQALAARIQEDCADIIASVPESTEMLSHHREFTYKAEKDTYYVSYFTIRRTGGHMTALVLYPTAFLRSRLFSSRLRILSLNLAAILVLFAFSWLFTGRLLTPIQHSQEQQTAFVAAASHELRTPLAVILASLEAIEDFPSKDASSQNPGREYSTDKELPSFLHTIKTESYRMSRLINDMLTLTRSDNHTWDFRMEPAELDTLLLDTYETWLPLSQQKHIHLTISLPEEILPPCRCDKERLAQALDILITNAMDYVLPAGHIHLAVSGRNRQNVITVSDNGPGIPDDQKEHIFERFYRSDTSRSNKEHFGLGLAIAREIVIAHKGDIQVADTPGGGATFRMVLPL